nr:hypothetical protein [Tanacetum cinerariifolium]
YVVPTGRVAVPTGRYVVPAGSDNEGDDASVHSEATNAQQQPNIQPQIITTVSNNNAKFHYLKKDEYEVWAIKIETGRDHDGRVIILPPTTADEHIAVQRESKARTTLIQSIPDDHTHEVDVKGYTTFYSSQSAGPSHSAFVSTTSSSKKMSYGDSPSYSLTTTYTAPLNSKTGNVIKDVLQSFVAAIEPEQQLAYEDFEQIEKLDLEDMDLKWQMAMLSVRVHKFEQKAEWKIDFDKKESARFNKKKVRFYKCQQRGHFARECRAKRGNDKQRYSSFKIKEIGKRKKIQKP